MCHRPDVFIKEVLNKPKHFTARKNWTYHTRIPLSVHSCSLSLPLSLPLSKCLSAFSSRHRLPGLISNFTSDQKKFDTHFFFSFSSFFFFLFLPSPLSSPSSLYSLIHSLSPPLSLSLTTFLLTHFKSARTKPKHVTISGVQFIY